MQVVADSPFAVEEGRGGAIGGGARATTREHGRQCQAAPPRFCIRLHIGAYPSKYAHVSTYVHFNHRSHTPSRAIAPFASFSSPLISPRAFHPWSDSIPPPSPRSLLLLALVGVSVLFRLRCPFFSAPFAPFTVFLSTTQLPPLGTGCVPSNTPVPFSPPFGTRSYRGYRLRTPCSACLPAVSFEIRLRRRWQLSFGDEPIPELGGWCRPFWE